MAIDFPDDYWLEIPGGRYQVGLLPDEARRLAEVSAAFAIKHGVPYTPNAMKNMSRAARMFEEHGNPKWVKEYLLAHYPARNVEIAPFSIARRPVTNREWRRFMAATGETQPRSWYQAVNSGDELAAQAIDWPAAVAFCEWSGARLPFEDEWEIAARGSERRLFPWGDQLEPHDGFLENEYTVYPFDRVTATPTGLLGMLTSGCEWCADLWSTPRRLDPQAWDDPSADPTARVVRADSDARFAPSCVSRFPQEIDWRGERHPRIRLIKADGRTIPAGSTTPLVLARLAIRKFKVHTLRRLFEELRVPRITDENQIYVDGDLDHPADRSVRSFISAQRGDHLLFDEPIEDTRPRDRRGGPVLALVSRESIRRIVPEHGIYLWTCQFKLDTATMKVAARPVVAYRMHFNKRVHVFEHRFDPNKEWTPLDEITDAQIRKHIGDTFWFYNQHADGDRSPF